MERQLPEGLATAAEELPKVTRKTSLGLVCLFSLAHYLGHPTLCAPPTYYWLSGFQGNSAVGQVLDRGKKRNPEVTSLLRVRARRFEDGGAQGTETHV